MQPANASGVVATVKKKAKKRGRIPLRDKYPLQELAEKFLNSCHGGADRSRATVNYEMSSTMASMKRFVDAGLRSYFAATGQPVPLNLPSKLTIRRLGIPPDRKLATADHYKGIIPFKRAPRNVDLTKEHPDFHYSASNVINMLEFASYFRDEVLMVSADNKNKIILGAPAVQSSRRPQGMFRTHQMPQMPDHSFPESDGSVVPQGYMMISSHRESEFEHPFRIRHESLNYDKPRKR